jgi:hypothetical protein
MESELVQYAFLEKARTDHEILYPKRHGKSTDG